METIELSEGIIIHYRHLGQGRPILLQHGWGGSSLYWQSTIAHLADIRSVYAIDLPGYGQSPPIPLDNPTPERLSGLLVEFVNRMGIDQFDLIGHSFGSNLAAHVAARYPDRVGQLVLTCPATYRNGGERRLIRVVHRMLGMTLRLRRTWIGRIPPVYRSMSQRFFYQLPTDNTLLLEGFKDFLRMDRRTAAESALNAVNDSINEILLKIDIPTLIVAATHDQILPRHGPSTVAQLIPDSRLVWIENCGHLPMVERPDVYHWILREFLLYGKPHRVTPEDGIEVVVRERQDLELQLPTDRTMPRIARRQQESPVGAEPKPVNKVRGEAELQRTAATAAQKAARISSRSRTKTCE